MSEWQKPLNVQVGEARGAARRLVPEKERDNFDRLAEELAADVLFSAQTREISVIDRWKQGLDAIVKALR